MLAGRAAEFCKKRKGTPVNTGRSWNFRRTPPVAFPPHQPIEHFAAAARSSALLTIRGLASFLALFVVTQYTSKLGLRAGISLGTLATALGFLFYAIAGKSYLLYCVPQINEPPRRVREVFGGRMLREIPPKRFEKRHRRRREVAAQGDGQR